MLLSKVPSPLYTAVIECVPGIKAVSYTHLDVYKRQGTSTATTLADSLGNYSFANLAPGSYTVTASKSGFNFNPCLLYTSQPASDSAQDP